MSLTERYKMINLAGVEVDAVQVMPANLSAIAKWVGGMEIQTSHGRAVEFLERGELRKAPKWQWVVKDDRGNFHVFSNGAFRAAFKKIEREEIETHDENTLLKVYAALEKSGLDHEEAIDAVNAMQNEGILFREIKVKE